MKKNNYKIQHLFSLTSILAAMLLAGCSEEEKAQPSQPAPKIESSKPAFDHEHGSDVSDMEKHKFEHEFADQCVERELKASNNKESERGLFEKPCLCIATFMMKDLTAKEAELFLVEHKNTQSLRIKFENAAYHCLQAKVQPKTPNLFSRQQQ